MRKLMKDKREFQLYQKSTTVLRASESKAIKHPWQASSPNFKACHSCSVQKGLRSSASQAAMAVLSPDKGLFSLEHQMSSLTLPYVNEFTAWHSAVIYPKKIHNTVKVLHTRGCDWQSSTLGLLLPAICSVLMLYMYKVEKCLQRHPHNKSCSPGE